MSYDPAEHYDRVTAAWTLLLGDELHYGVFREPSDDLALATRRLTDLMIDAARIEPGHELLDVGCGTGAPARRLARETGARVTAITTSGEGVRVARALAKPGDEVAYLQRDGMDNGFPDASFDRVWVLESSHLMRRRDRLIAECARVLRPNGRLVLCDIVLRQPLAFDDVRRLREPLALLREVFGDARMEPLDEYRRLAAANGLDVDVVHDLTAPVRPTFDHWRARADRHREALAASLGEDGRRRFVAACDVLEGLWEDGTFGYALLAATR